jgi:hypothetical protein
MRFNPKFYPQILRRTQEFHRDHTGADGCRLVSKPGSALLKRMPEPSRNTLLGDYQAWKLSCVSSVCMSELLRNLVYGNLDQINAFS